MSASAPAIGPETRIASTRDETTSERASCAGVRWPSGLANSGVTLAKTARSSRPKARRSRRSWATSLLHVPMSDSHGPPSTARMNEPPAPTAAASAQCGSQR